MKPPDLVIKVIYKFIPDRDGQRQKDTIPMEAEKEFWTKLKSLQLDDIFQVYTYGGELTR